MIKKVILLLCVMIYFPALAHAWTIAARIGSPSGSITGGDPTVVTVSSGTGYLTVPAGDASVTITPASGYRISVVTLDGVNQTIPTSGGAFTVLHEGRTSRALTAYFTPITYTMTVNRPPGGLITLQRISPTVGTITSTVLGSLRTGDVVRVTASPNVYYRVTSITVDGASVWTGDSVLPEYYDYTVESSNTIASATWYLTPLVTARIYPSAGRTSVAGSINLDCTASTTNDAPLSYQYSVVLGDPSKVTITPDSTGSQATFQASAPGEYQVQVTVTSARGGVGTATTYVLYVETQSEFDSGICISCHDAWAQTTAFRFSTHYLTTTVTCISCHDPDRDLPHPYISQPTGSCQACHGSVSPAVVTQYLASPHNGVATCTGCHNDHSVRSGFNVCGSCHTTLYAANAIHYNGATLLSGLCQGCHVQHSFIPVASRAHFNGYTSPVNPNFGAAYVTPATQCANCHITANGTPDAANDPALLQARTDWAASGHGDTKGPGWIAADFKTLSGCVQCHTPIGFIAYSTAKVAGAWGTASDKTRNVLSCDGCHTNIGTGALRTSSPVQPYGSDPYVNPDLSTSNLCMRCHSGTQSGRNIKAQAAANADFSNLAFIGSHSSAAAGILLNSAGYEYAFKSYSNSRHFKHDRIGNNHFKAYGYNSGIDGPCVGCHMSTSNKHSFLPLSKDANGVVTSITSTSCPSCHTGPAYLDAGRMNAREAKFAAVLLALQKVLETRGIYYADTAPYFFKSAGNTAPGNAFTNWGNADTMGAAFNFNLLQHEPGAYAHNMIYTKRLIYDSIDFLDNGVFDNSVSATVGNLAGLNAVQKTTAKGYLTPTGSRP